MLCDDFGNDQYLTQVYRGLDRVTAKVRGATKFVLHRDFAAAADGLVDNYEELQRVVPYCRLPYPVTWVELLHDDRPHWNPDGTYGARPVDPARYQHAPHRLGFLLEQDGADAGRFTAHLVWSFKERLNPEANYNVSMMVTEFDGARGAAKPSDPLAGAVESRLGDHAVEMMQSLSLKTVKDLAAYATEDWGGEMRFLVAVLGLLNAKNVAQTEVVDHSKQNEKRQRHGQRQLFSHTVVKVRSSAAVSCPAAGPGGHREVRLHFVRGHFKRRSSGLYWWSMHARGAAKRGQVTHDYEVDL